MCTGRGGRAKGREKSLQRIYRIVGTLRDLAHALTVRRSVCDRRTLNRLGGLAHLARALHANRFHGPNSCRNTLNLTLP